LTWEGLNPPYGTIVADPPWAYRTTKGITTRASHGTACAEDNYSTMTNTELAALPVVDLAADNAHLYMWVTNPKLYGDRKRNEPAPDEIMEAWGFRYITMLTWLKKPGALGLGFYFRGQTEHVLFGVRGKLGIPAAERERNYFEEMGDFFEAGTTGHSRKPLKFFDIVERVSPGPYIELFCREPKLGWDSHGLGFESAHLA
jgi:N6-adenosine-specific RNA methylase IME4